MSRKRKRRGKQEKGTVIPQIPKSGMSTENKAAIIGAIVGAIVGAVLTLVVQFIITYRFPVWFNKPQVTVSPQVLANVKGTISDLINVEPNIYNVYKARIVEPNRKELVNDMVYDFIRGDAENPGYTVVALSLQNTGDALAVIDGFYVEVVDYQSMDEIEYSLYKAGEISDPDSDIKLYSSVDPLIKKSLAQPAEMSEGVLRLLDYKMLNIQLSPNDNKTYYIKMMFPKYGIYTLDVSVYYDYKNKFMKSSIENTTGEYVRVLYDGLTYDQIIDKTSR